MTLQVLLTTIILSALNLLPAKMDSRGARVFLVATHLQEDPRDLPVQMGGGPAHGFWQFEKGGAVHGVMTHPATSKYAFDVCKARGVPFLVDDVYAALAKDEILSCCFARLLAWTDAAALPDPVPQSVDQAWEYYKRNWRPGKPGPDRWPGNWQAALAAVDALDASDEPA